MKGLELPINIIIVIAIAVLALVIVSIFFVSNFSGGSDSIGLESALQSGCTNLRALYSCDSTKMTEVKIPNYNINGKQASLADVCVKKGVSDNAQCAQKLCSCPA